MKQKKWESVKIALLFRAPIDVHMMWNDNYVPKNTSKNTSTVAEPL